MLTLSEAATKIKVHPETLRRWVMTGKYRNAGRAGRDLRFREEDLERFIFPRSRA